jgi:hypothetical protein
LATAVGSTTFIEISSTFATGVRSLLAAFQT